jgi:flagellin
LGNGNGTFGSGIVSDYAGFGVGVESLALLDVDGDGNLEFLYSEPIIGDMTIQFANTVKQTTFERLNLASREGALEALDTIEEALTRVKNELGTIGANQSRLGATLEVVQATELNYKAAFGRIVDIDTAQETARLTANQIRQQSATAVLAQANQLPALTLSLLQA